VHPPRDGKSTSRAKVFSDITVRSSEVAARIVGYVGLRTRARFITEERRDYRSAAFRLAVNTDSLRATTSRPDLAGDLEERGQIHLSAFGSRDVGVMKARRRAFLFQIGETPRDQNAEQLPFASGGEGERRGRNGITLLCKAAAG